MCITTDIGQKRAHEIGSVGERIVGGSWSKEFNGVYRGELGESEAACASEELREYAYAHTNMRGDRMRTVTCRRHVTQPPTGQRPAAL
jgi:hypothetical protein